MSIVQTIQKEIAPIFAEDASGHDLHHINRVLEMSRYLQSKEGGDLEIIELAALLHDISDHKFNGGKLNEGGNAAAVILHRHAYPSERIEQIKEIIDSVSFKGAGVETHAETIEAQIVQDADRLDAIGAIGIGRTFAYGGHKGQAMYDPELEATSHNSFEEYAQSKTTTINHFHEKLLLLKDRLNTDTAKQIGQERHELMLKFLADFEKEWNFKSE